MLEIFEPQFYDSVLITMSALAVVVFFALLFLTAPYGMAYSPKWGPSMSNRVSWVLMEAPAFFVMLLLWILSPRGAEAGAAVCAALYLLHYFQRSFIFPLLMKGKSRMPVVIMLMGLTFNVINAYMIGAWLFRLAPEEMYSTGWLATPQFGVGAVIFFIGMGINIDSDRRVRNLRKPGDTKHYIPRGGMFRYVTSANYFGELTEWVGFAVMTWCWAGAVFVLWTFANLAPRARKLHQRYISEFGDEYRRLNRRYIIPGIF